MIKKRRFFASLEKNFLTGFTLIEVMITVMIIAVLVAIAVPRYTKAVERARAKEATTNLMIIRAGERIYRLERGSYYPVSGSVSNLTTINNNLNIELSPSDFFDYQISGNGADFTATATRKNQGPCANQNIIITQDSDEPDTSACSIW